MIITKTPYRLSFFGGGTDYRPWFEKNGGLVIASAIERYCYLTVRYLPPFFEHKSRMVYSKSEFVNDHEEFQHPSVRNCLKFMAIEQGVEIHHDGDLPARSGIGSSSSFTVGLLHALHALRYEMVTKETLANEAIMIEQDWIGEDVGIQDQIMAAHGGLKIIEMGPKDQYSVRPMILPPEYLKAIESHILLGFSGISRFSTQYAKSQIENIENGKSHQTLSEIQSLAHEALALFQKQANLDELGDLIDKSWKMKRSLTCDMSNSIIDDVYAIAKKNGAFGGKLMGAGGGGFVMFLAPPYRHEAIQQALSQIKVWIPFKFDMMGSQVIFHKDSR
jgi:D-glycero-alpha-D-manno-heptose-7-phosphate kinase